jgi:hypothetical protein
MVTVSLTLPHGEGDIYARGVVDLEDDVADIGLLEPSVGDLDCVFAYGQKFQPVSTLIVARDRASKAIIEIARHHRGARDG